MFFLYTIFPAAAILNYGKNVGVVTEGYACSEPGQLLPPSVQQQTAAGEASGATAAPSGARNHAVSLVAAAVQYLLYLREGSALGLEDDVVGEECARQAVECEEREHCVHPCVLAHRAVQLRTQQNKIYIIISYHLGYATMQLILKPHKRVSKIEYDILNIEYCPQPLFPHAAHRSQMVQDKPLST